MEKIYELADLVFKRKDVFDAMFANQETNPIRKLCKIVFSKTRLNDEQCMLKIYGKRNVNAFNALKARLTSKLNLLLILVQESTEEKYEAKNQRLANLREILVGGILISKGSVDMGLNVLEKAIDVSIRKDFTENTIITAKRLMIGYGTDRFNEYKYSKYAKIQTEYINIYNWELKSQEYFYELQKVNISSLSLPSKELISKTLSCSQELEKVEGIRTPLFLYNKYRLHALYLEYIKDYQKLLEISQKAILDFADPTYKMSIELANIYVRIIVSYIQIDQYKNAIKLGNEVLSNVTIGTNTWFRINYYLIKAFLYLRKYQEAFSILISVFKNKSYLKKYSYYLEAYLVVYGYINLLIISDYFKPEIVKMSELPEFKLGKYLNSLPIYSKDKRGLNISILLMHIAFLLQRKDYDAIIDRTDSLNQYAYRYLRRDDSFRSNCMIKMVIQMTKADFNPVRTERYTADLLKQLKSVNLAGSGENIEIEVIPFEVLWEIMLKSLKN